MSGCSSSPSTASLSPCTTLSTPGGSPASRKAWAIRFAAVGSFSLGLSTTALPQAIATGTNHSGTMDGKLNGEITATTPRGCRIEYTSTPVETPSLNPPLSRCGMPQANSTISRPRCTSPAASESTLPCSAVMAAAISPLRWESSSRAAKSTFCRAAREDVRHAVAALTAEATTWSTSARLARRTRACCSPVAGS